MTGTLPRIGLHSDDLHLGARKAMDLAARLGFGAIELGAVDGEIAPENLSASGRRHLVRYATQKGLSIVALGATLCGPGHHDVAALERNLVRLHALLDMAREVRVEIVTAPLGLPGPPEDEWFEHVREGLVPIAEHADGVGCAVALTTAGGAADELAALVGALRCERIRVCYDPGELLMAGCDPLAPIETLADHIGLSHIRDGVLGSATRAGRETRLGQGQLNIEAYLGHLAQAGYHGPHILRRGQVAQASADLAAGRDLLAQIMR